MNLIGKILKLTFIILSILFLSFIILIPITGRQSAINYEKKNKCRSNLFLITHGLFRYYDMNDKFPEKLEYLISSKIMRKIPVCPSDKKHYIYIISKNKRNFALFCLYGKHSMPFPDSVNMKSLKDNGYCCILKKMKPDNDFLYILDLYQSCFFVYLNKDSKSEDKKYMQKEKALIKGLEKMGIKDAKVKLHYSEGAVERYESLFY